MLEAVQVKTKAGMDEEQVLTSSTQRRLEEGNSFVMRGEVCEEDVVS